MSNLDIKQPSKEITKYYEEDFYQPLAGYLKGNLDEAVEAISLGGASMGKKWGTPDVLGVYKPSSIVCHPFFKF